jgi:hypothetical protein
MRVRGRETAQTLGHTFVHADDHGLRVEFAVADGRAAGITIRQLGLVIPGRRVP